MHLGVGIIIRNKSGDSFFIQEKDETYPVEQYRNCCSLFGGKIEDGETPFEGLKRELMEEVDFGDLILRMNIRFVRSFCIQKSEGAFFIQERRDAMSIPVGGFEFNLFEGVLGDGDFEVLRGLRIFEGRSKILDKNSLVKMNWIWGLEGVISFYISGGN